MFYCSYGEKAEALNSFFTDKDDHIHTLSLILKILAFVGFNEVLSSLVYRYLSWRNCTNTLCLYPEPFHPSKWEAHKYLYCYFSIYNISLTSEHSYIEHVIFYFIVNHQDMNSIINGYQHPWPQPKHSSIAEDALKAMDALEQLFNRSQINDVVPVNCNTITYKVNG